MERAIIVSRCSTNEAKQDVTRQTQELTKKYANQYEIVQVIEYYQSGTKNEEKNKEILAYCIDNNIQHIITSEISRIARKVKEVNTFIYTAEEHKINVIIDNYNLHSLDKDKKINVITQMILNIGASFSAMELELTKTRMQSGLKKYVEGGGRIGRKEGSEETTEQFLAKHKDVVKQLKQGQSIRNTIKLTGKSNMTVQKVKKLM